MLFANSSLKMTSVKLLLQQCDLPLRYLIKWQSVSIKYEANCFLKICFLL